MSCYYPNHILGDGLKPCNTTAAVSHCCRIGDVCLTNGYCFSAGLNALVRRGCTDQTFNSTECPQECSKLDTDKVADVILTPCNGYSTFCCGQDDAARNCCTNENGTIKLPAGSAMLEFGAAPVTGTASIVTSTATVSLIVTQTAAGSSTSSGDYDALKKTTIGVGAGLGALLVIVAVLLAYKWITSDKEIDRLTRGQRASRR